MSEWLYESLRRRADTLSEKNEVKDSARDGFSVDNESVVVCLRCSNEFIFFQRRHGLGIDD